MKTDTLETMHDHVIALLVGDRPHRHHQALYAAAILIRRELPTLDRREEIELDVMLGYATHLASEQAPSLADEAWSRVQSPAALRRGILHGVGDDVETVCASIHARIAGWRAERLASADGTAASECEMLLARMREAFPRLGLSFGYIGNCDFGGRRDDRSWRFFTKLATPTCHAGCDVSFGGFATARLGRLATAARTGLEAWCAEQERRLDAGELRRVGDDVAKAA